MTARNMRFNHALRHFTDGRPDGRRSDRSDGCKGSAMIYASLDRLFAEDAGNPPPSPHESALLDDATLLMWGILLNAVGMQHLMATLWLISRNGNDTATSIRRLRKLAKCSWPSARRRYFRHRKLLLRMFETTNKIGGFIDLSRFPCH